MCLFLDEATRPHPANLVDEFLESGDNERIPSPSKSPKLQGDNIRKIVARRHPPPRDSNVLKTALLEEWNFIHQTVANNVIVVNIKHIVICVHPSRDHISK